MLKTPRRPTVYAVIDTHYIQYCNNPQSAKAEGEKRQTETRESRTKIEINLFPYSTTYCLGNQVLEIETLDFARDVLSNIGNRPLLLSKYWKLD